MAAVVQEMRPKRKVVDHELDMRRRVLQMHVARPWGLLAQEQAERQGVPQGMNPVLRQPIGHPYDEIELWVWEWNEAVPLGGRRRLIDITHSVSGVPR